MYNWVKYEFFAIYVHTHAGTAGINGLTGLGPP